VFSFEPWLSFELVTLEPSPLVLSLCTTFLMFVPFFLGTDLVVLLKTVGDGGPTVCTFGEQLTTLAGSPYTAAIAAPSWETESAPLLDLELVVMWAAVLEKESESARETALGALLGTCVGASIGTAVDTSGLEPL
jgi:hypothetical protein